MSNYYDDATGSGWSMSGSDWNNMGSDIVDNKSHVTSNGSDHNWIDQDVTTTGSVLFSDMSVSGTVTVNDFIITNEFNANDKNIVGVGTIGYTQELDNGSKTTDFSIDFGTDQKQKVTLTANTITLTLDTTFNRVANYVLKIVNGGLATLTWASESGSILWSGGTAPTLTSSGTDIVSFYYDGTNWYGQAGVDFS